MKLVLLVLMSGAVALAAPSSDIREEHKRKLATVINPKANAERKEVPYTVVEKNDKYEVRTYPAWNWACLDADARNRTDFTTEFLDIVDYLQEANVEKEQMKLIAPVIIQRSQLHPGSIAMCAPVPPEQQETLPTPLETNIRLVAVPETGVFVRRFPGRPIGPGPWLREASALRRQLDQAGETIDPQGFMQALFSAPSQRKNRRNEVWIVRP